MTDFKDCLRLLYGAVVGYLIIFTISMACCGCGPPRGEYYASDTIESVPVNYLMRLSPKEHRRLASSIERTIVAWETDFGVENFAIKIYVTREINCGPFGNRIGCSYIGESIYIIPGDYLEVPALYHELCHVAQPVPDPNHTDANWPLWDMRGEAVAADIRRSRETWTTRIERSWGWKRKYD